MPLVQITGDEWWVHVTRLMLVESHPGISIINRLMPTDRTTSLTSIRRMSHFLIEWSVCESPVQQLTVGPGIGLKLDRSKES